MANSPRPAAPRSAHGSATPTYSTHRTLMSLNDIEDAIGNVSNSLAALCALLGAANGAPLSADYLHVLLSPLHELLEQALDDLNDMPLVEAPDNPLPVLDTVAPAPAAPHITDDFGNEVQIGGAA